MLPLPIRVSQPSGIHLLGENGSTLCGRDLVIGTVSPLWGLVDCRHCEIIAEKSGSYVRPRVAARFNGWLLVDNPKAFISIAVTPAQVAYIVGQLSGLGI